MGTYGQTVYWNYSYNQNSQVSQISEHVYRNYPEISDQQAQFSYEYDHWGRLAAAGHATYNGSIFVPDQTNSFSYDQFGNMLTNNLTFPGDPQSNWYSSFNVNAADNRLASYTNSQGTTSTTYDAAGNMLTEGSRSYAFDGAGRMTSAGPGAGTYRYDALGQRIKKTYSYQGQSGTISGSIVSIYGPGGELLADYVVENGSSSRTDYILYGSQAIARRSVPQSGSATVQDLYRNHVNQIFDLSTYTVTTGLSTMYGIPFGSGGNDQFSGHKDDPESGLHYNLARSYNPTIARWTSPDPIVGNAFDPQSLNKYGYVRNDPVNKIDPDGRFPSSIYTTSEFQYYLSMGWTPQEVMNFYDSLPGANWGNSFYNYWDAGLYYNQDLWAGRNDQVLPNNDAAANTPEPQTSVETVEGPKIATPTSNSTFGRTLCTVAGPVRALAHLMNSAVGMGGGGSVAVLVGLGGTEGANIQIVADPMGNAGIVLNFNAGIAGFGASAIAGGQVSIAPNASIYDLLGWSVGGNIGAGGGPAFDFGVYTNYNESTGNWGPTTFTGTIGKGVGTRVAASSVGYTTIPIITNCGN